MLLFLFVTSQEEELLAKLELELEIQDKICKAASKLIKDNSVNKTARKQRRQSYHRAHQKVPFMLKNTQGKEIILIFPFPNIFIYRTFRYYIPKWFPRFVLSLLLF